MAVTLAGMPLQRSAPFRATVSEGCLLRTTEESTLVPIVSRLTVYQ